MLDIACNKIFTADLVLPYNPAWLNYNRINMEKNREIMLKMDCL